MAEQPIKHNDIIEIDKTLEGINKIIKQLKRLQAEMKKTAKNVIAFQTGQDPSTPKGKEGTKTASDQTSKLVRENEKLARSIKDVTKEQVRLKKSRQEMMRETRRQIQIIDASKGSLDRNRVALQKLTERYNRAAPNAAQKMQKRMQNLTNTISKQEQAIGKHQRNVGNYKSAFGKAQAALKSFGIGMIGATALISGFNRIMKSATKNAIDFEKEFTNVLTLLDQAQISEFGGMLKTGTLQIMKKYGLSIEDVNKALFDTLSAGIPASEAIEFLNNAARLAVAGNSDLSSAILGMTKIMSAYDLEAKEATRITEALFAAQKFGQTTIQELSTAIANSTSIASQYGIEYSELLTIFAVLTKRLKNTDETATAVTSTIQALTKGGPDVQKAFEDMGITFGATALITDGLWKKLVQIASATKENKDDLVKLVPRMQALRGVGALTTETLIEYQEILNFVNDTEKANLFLTDGLNLQMDTKAKLLSRLQARWKALGSQESAGLSLSRKIAANIAERNPLTEEQTKLTEEQIKTEKERLAILEDIDRIEKERLANIAAAKAKEAAKIEAELGLEKAKEILRLFHLDIELTEKLIDSDLAAAESRDEIEAERIERLKESDEEYRDLKFKLDQESRDREKIAQDKADDERRRGIEATIMESANVLFAIQDLRMTRLETEKNREIELAEGNKEKILAIEKKFGEEQKKIAITTALIDSSVAIVKTLASVKFPFNFIAAGLVAAATGIQVAAINSQTFAKGGHGELDGPSHSQGGIQIPGVGEAQGKEYFGVINQQMTRKYRQDLPGIFDSINAGKFHDVWSNANIQLQTNVDPWTKKMYDQMMKTPTVHTDSEGSTVLVYPHGYTQVIKKK